MCEPVHTQEFFGFDCGREQGASARSRGSLDALPPTRCAIYCCPRGPRGSSCPHNHRESGECRLRGARTELSTPPTLSAILDVPPDLGGDVDARHHCYLCRRGSSIDHFGASRPLASKQSRSNRIHCLPCRASDKRMRVRIPAHPLAGSVGPLALGPLHFEDAQESISRKHGELAAPAT